MLYCLEGLVFLDIQNRFLRIQLNMSPGYLGFQDVKQCELKSMQLIKLSSMTIALSKEVEVLFQQWNGKLNCDG